MSEPVSSYSQNKQATFGSLVACVQLLYAKDKKTFLQAYYLATHENSGEVAWSVAKKRYSFRECFDKDMTESELKKEYYKQKQDQIKKKNLERYYKNRG